MLKDLLRGKPRDITPHNRPTCFDGLSGGGSGGDGAFCVNVARNSADKTYEEIIAAYEAGLYVYAKDERGNLFPLSDVKNGSVRFCGVLGIISEGMIEDAQLVAYSISEQGDVYGGTGRNIAFN